MKSINLHIVPAGTGASFSHPLENVCTLPAAKRAAEAYYRACAVKPLAVLVKRLNGKVPAVYMNFDDSPHWLSGT
jgi:hypothetical protein